MCPCETQAYRPTRGSYLPGRDYGSTRAKVNYTVPQIDITAFQAITDKAWEDFKVRLTAAGVKLHSRGFAGLGAGNIGKRIEWSKSNLEALSISVAVNIAALESSGYSSRRPLNGKVSNRIASMTLDLPPLFPPTRTVRSGRRLTVTLSQD